MKKVVRLFGKKCILDTHYNIKILLTVKNPIKSAFIITGLMGLFVFLKSKVTQTNENALL